MVTDILHHANYVFNVYSIPQIVTGVAILLLGILALIKERLSRVSLVFFIGVIGVSSWSVATALLYFSANAQVASFWAKAIYLILPFCAPASYHYTSLALHIYQQQRKFILFSWIMAGLFSASIIGTNALVSGVYTHWWGYYAKFGWLGALFPVYFIGVWVVFMRNFWVEFPKATPGGIFWRRTRLLFIAFGIGYLGASSTFIPAYGFPIYTAPYIPVCIFVVIVLRVFLRYRIVDITPEFAANKIINTMSEALLVLDQKGAIRLVNPALTELFRLAEEKLLGKPFAALLEDPLFSEKLYGSMASRNHKNYEFVYRPLKGEAKTLSLSSSKIMDWTGQLAAIVCHISDVTEQKRSREALKKAKEELEMKVEDRTEELRSANEQLRREMAERKRVQEELLRARDCIIDEMKRKREYVFEIADRLRNPLQKLIGFIEIFETENLASSQRDIFNKIEKSCQDIKDGVKKLT